ncbi:ring-cleaving dioxygenase [bacterium]|nr:ring-cleaving dioxygenase [bacterium]
MSPTISGIHHITAITADAQKNIDFYCGVLGLRLVKLTVNFDDPESYHLYYGDRLGRPGSIMTFFAWPGATRGRIGPPQVTTVAFAVSAQALEFWAARLKESGFAFWPGETRFGEGVLGFEDPDGIRLELIATAGLNGESPDGPIPPESAIQRFHGVTISEEGHENTAKLLTEIMGFKDEGREGHRYRYRSANGESVVDLLCIPAARRGGMGAGVVHHIAYRTLDDAQQLEWRDELVGLGYNVSSVMDRVYFHSIYYRDPGGVLFEIATDPPGFTIDEPAEKLGSILKLPPWFERRRAELEQILPPVRLPEWRLAA